jgi:outer membrane protein X
MKTMNVLKRAAWLAVVSIALVVNVSAQEKGDMAAGASVFLGSGDSFSNYGLGAKFRYNVTSPIRLEGSFAYFFEKDMISMWDLSVNVHYLFSVADKLTVYPLAGLGILGASVDVPEIDLGEWGSAGGGSASDSEFGFNLGGGLDYQFTDKIGGNVELRYKIGDEWNRLLISAGVTYKF